MSENNYVSVDDYKELCSFIKENMDEFLEQIVNLIMYLFEEQICSFFHILF